MLHHISIGVRDLSQSTKFYDSVLSVLGYRRYMSKPGTESWKKTENGIAFWINQRANLSVVEDSGNHDLTDKGGNVAAAKRPQEASTDGQRVPTFGAAAATRP